MRDKLVLVVDEAWARRVRFGSQRNSAFWLDRGVEGYGLARVNPGGERVPQRVDAMFDTLLDRRCLKLMCWGKKFDIAVSVAMGLEYLHHADFGLARVKAVEDLGMMEGKKEGVVEIAVEEFGVMEEGGDDKLSVVSDGCFESVDNENVNLNKKKGGGGSGRDWW
ncbi:Receptor-like serine/threonine-protein [Vigna angularis]|uniref:Receptor-like serine/threonine-protein n=1 Tax=Phaseolus angularis TaxID=3914 RepID=A0A8T0JLG2_PHAAN|nr:Receptor-like serine/threonine-protein [Vigna angularis]